MSTSDSRIDAETLPVLPEDVPVEMPGLPLRLVVNTAQQLKALGEPVRSRILGVILHQPATAKQIAERLGLTPGAIGHHLHVLEAVGLAQVVAKRLVKGIVASYYTRTARIFDFEFPDEVRGEHSTSLHFVNRLRDDLAETLQTYHEDGVYNTSFPRNRLSVERLKVYQERVNQLVEDFIAETPNPQGQVCSLFTAFFLSPAYMQGDPKESD